MIQRVLASKSLVAYVLACVTGLTLYFRWPFPEDDLMLHLIALRAPNIYAFFKYSYTLFLFTTPFIAYSVILSGVYIFAFRPTRKLKPKALPPYPEPGKRQELSLVLGEVHDPRKPVPAENPYWLTVPERGLYTGIAILGAIGTGKTSGCMYPYAEQLVAYQAHDPETRIGGLVLEVKGDFCHKVRGILKRHGREGDYVEVSLQSCYRYNPLHNDLDAYALGLQHRLPAERPLWEGQDISTSLRTELRMFTSQFGSLECPILSEDRSSHVQEYLPTSGMSQQGKFDSGRVSGTLREKFEPYVHCREAANFLGLHCKTVERYARQGVLPAHLATGRRRKRWRFLISELDVWLRSRVISPCHPCSPEK